MSRQLLPLIAGAVLLTAVAGGCGGDVGAGGGGSGVDVVATTTPAEFVRNVGGERVGVHQILRRQVEPPVGEPPQALAVALDHELGGHPVLGRVDQGPGVAGREEIQPQVVGEEQLGGVEASREGKVRPAAPRA